MAATKAKRSIHRLQPKKARKAAVADKSPSVNLRPTERKFGSHRSVEFFLVDAKTTERVEFYSIADYHCITIDFEDKTSLNLEIEPCFTINAELQQRRKGERDMILEWPPIPSQK